MSQIIYTPEDIRLRKAQLRKQIRKSKQSLKSQANRLVTPNPVRNKFELGYQLISNGMAVYDGVKMGLQVVRYVKKLF